MWAVRDGGCKVGCRLPVAFAEVGPAQHRVDEIIRGVKSREPIGERMRLEQVALNDGGPFRAGAALVAAGVAHQDRDLVVALEQPRHEAASDIARGACHQNPHTDLLMDPCEKQHARRRMHSRFGAGFPERAG